MIDWLAFCFGRNNIEWVKRRVPTLYPHMLWLPSWRGLVLCVLWGIWGTLQDEVACIRSSRYRIQAIRNNSHGLFMVRSKYKQTDNIGIRFYETKIMHRSLFLFEVGLREGLRSGIWEWYNFYWWFLLERSIDVCFVFVRNECVKENLIHFDYDCDFSVVLGVLRWKKGLLCSVFWFKLVHQEAKAVPLRGIIQFFFGDSFRIVRFVVARIVRILRVFRWLTPEERSTRLSQQGRCLLTGEGRLSEEGRLAPERRASSLRIAAKERCNEISRNRKHSLSRTKYWIQRNLLFSTLNHLWNPRYQLLCDNSDSFISFLFHSHSIHFSNRIKYYGYSDACHLSKWTKKIFPIYQEWFSQNGIMED